MRSLSSRQSTLNLIERRWVANCWSSQRRLRKMMDSRYDQSKVTKLTNVRLEFLGGGQPVD